MIICIPNVLTAEELVAINQQISQTTYVDGSTTAGWSAREVKKNLQIPLDSASYDRLADLVYAGFVRESMLQAAILPATATRPLFNRYEIGMQYGPHVDAPLMGDIGNKVRSDIAITIFLSDPRSYDGGELAMTTQGMECKFKLDAGSAIAYPANTLHHVTPVTRGVRNGAVIWVQSQVRDPARRELLWDLENAKRAIFGREGKSATFDAVSRSHANLLRMWAEV